MQNLGTATPLGRPRQSGIVTEDPREEILAVAAQLFARKGYAATQMKEVARESGLAQSSIYYWFRSKSEILRAIIDQNRESLRVLSLLKNREDPAAIRLYIVLYQDIVQMCEAPLNFYDLEAAASAQPDVFTDFHTDYDALAQGLESIVADGIASSEFVDVPISGFVRTALSLNEGTQHRYRTEAAAGADMRLYADLAVTTSVRSILRDVTTMSSVQKFARRGIDGLSAA